MQKYPDRKIVERPDEKRGCTYPRVIIIKENLSLDKNQDDIQSVTMITLLSKAFPWANPKGRSKRVCMTRIESGLLNY
jgi:hypothetical protein